MTSPGQYGSHQYQSPETRALASITAESYDKDQAKTIIKLKNDVGYMAAYMRKMQKSIDQANENFLQQIQSFIADFVVLLGGGSLTTIDFGDLRYVIQAIGALLGFQTVAGIPIPINLFTAAWNFFGVYIAPTQQFADVINELIDAAIAIIIDALGDIPVFGQAIEQLAGWLIEIRDALWPLVDTVFLLIDTLSGQPGTAADDVMTGLFDQIINILLTTPDVLLQVTNAVVDLLVETPEILLALLNGLIQMLIDSPTILTTLLNSLVNLLLSLPDVLERLLTGLIELLLSLPNMLGELLASLINLLLVTPDILLSLLSGLIQLLIDSPSILLDLLSSLIGLLIVTPNILLELANALVSSGAGLLGINSPLDATKLFNLVPGGSVPNLDASKITSGTFASAQLQTLINSISTGFGGSTGLGFSGLTSLLSGLPGAQQLTDAISNALGHSGTGHTANDVLGYLGLIPGANIASAVAASVVPALDASKITTGIFGALRIPNLDAAKITSGQFPQSMVNITSIAAGIVTGILGVGQIPNLPASIINSGSFLAAQIPNLDASKITTGQFAQSFLNITSIAAGIVTGTLGVGQIPGLPASQITSGIFGSGLIPALDASKITTGVFSDGYLPGLGTLRDSIGQAIYGGALSYTAAQVKTALGVIPGANIASAVAAAIIPAHDASKITTGIFGTSLIPNLDAGKITTGTLLSSLIPSLPASIITSGIFPAAQIPALDATKITSGILALAQIPGIDVARVPSLPASQITSGTFGTGLIPSLDAAKITTGIFGTSLIPGLDASKIVSGLFGASQIPSLDASKVTTGTFAQSMVSGLPAALASMLTSTSPLNSQYLFNQVPSSLVGMVPFSHIGNANPNLIAASSFDNAASVLTNPGWGWDGTDGYTTNGCASATANGSLLQLVSNIIQVAPGQTLSIGARVKYLGLTATAGQNAIQIVVAQYSGSIPGATTMIASIASPSGNSAGFVPISGNYTVPASGVDNIVVQLVVTQAATAGTVKYDDAFANKTGLMSGNWMSGISGTVSADIQSTVDQIFQAVQGGASTGNALSTIKNNLLNFPGANIATALGAGVIPGLDASKIISGALSLLRIPNLPTSQITSGTFLASLIPTLDASKIASGVMALAQIPTNLLNKSNISDIQTMSDQLTNSLIGTGNTYTGTDILSQARPSMDAIYNNVMNAVNSLQALRSQSTATNISGVNVNINFQNYADGPLPSNFTVTYSGPGSSTIGVSGGVAGFTNLVNNGNRRAFIVWNSGPTNTDFQIVRGTMSSPPSGSGSGGQPYIYAMGRVDNPANPQNFVWARAYCTGFLTYKADLGYTVAGVETVMLGNIGLTWSLDINVLFGANANPRRYQAYSGTQLVFDYIESGTNSKLGAGYRYWGCVAQMVTGSGGAVSPGGIAATSVSDNAPPNVLGSTFRVSRHNTATVNYANSGAGAPVKIGANFFDTLDWISPDMTWDGQNVTVNTEGTYLCVLRLNTNNIPGNTKFTPVIYQNNVAEAMVGGGFSDGSFSAQAVGGTGAGTIVYVKAGDFFSAGTAADGGGKLAGDSLGMSCYFEMALLNRSMQ